MMNQLERKRGGLGKIKPEMQCPRTSSCTASYLPMRIKSMSCGSLLFSTLQETSYIAMQ